MNHALDQYSKPLKVEKTRLASIYSLNSRDSKKGRLFMPLFDERFPLAFRVKYTYLSKFLERDNASGNHYHRIKEEILIPLQGTFEIYLEDVESREREMISLSGDDNKGIYIKTGISHKVVSREESGILLVLASSHSTLEDEIEYIVE
ncbi:MAG: WxcM-like domain-containing protein [Marinilabiliaceae bacterium]|jgi:dTDP-4-dehydrorhamnose 3,5-epimerase-like enzyme|nr:WxcM-like domain-containing protein [Marinilabiliaceae bacterium]